MSSRASDRFTTVRTEGAILPADLLMRVAGGDAGLDGLSPASFHLIEGEKLNEATNRSWNRLLGAWSSFQAAVERLPSSDLGNSVTRDRWLLPLWQELGYGRLTPARPVEVDGKTYPISHAWQHAPIHLVGCRADLDRRVPGVAGAAMSSPHGLVQELLNRSEVHLWGFVSNGVRLRILRDNIRLKRQAYVEFDLQAMFDGKDYADFALLWRLCHQSRVEAEEPERCWLERWSRAAQQQGLRVLDQLRNGVEAAIAALGSGFLACPANGRLRDRLRAGQLDAQDYYRQLLRLVYRLLFLFVAEDRELIFHPAADEASRERYSAYYSTARLRRLAERLRGTQHSDLYQVLTLVMERLGGDRGCPELGLPALGSLLFSPDAIPDLRDGQLANSDLLAAVRALALTNDGQALRAVDYRNLGSEELGSIYESLLELHPVLNAEAGTFSLGTASGHERKTTGSYYTPTSLITCLLDSALDPVLDEAVRQPEPEAALLKLKVCDPACGSGHFLIAAAHRIAKRLAFVRTGEEEPPPQAVRAALRDAIGHCVYGVDVNPMSVELCKVALWMEALEPGKPLSFLDHHVQCGNSLIGATPALLARGIPDGAFEPIEGDDKVACRDLRKRNRDERQGQGTMFDRFDSSDLFKLGNLAPVLARIAAITDDTIEGVHDQERAYAELVRSSGYRNNRLWADAWCASFVIRKEKAEDLQPRIVITEKIFRAIERNPHVAPSLENAIRAMSDQYQFFHWHLAFPDVFQHLDATDEGDILGWQGGFDVVLGNPPWERIKLQDQEWFAERRPEIAKAPNAAARRRMIALLAESDPSLYQAFLSDRRQSEGERHFLRNSGRYPLCGRGDVNTYTIFAETNRQVICPDGRVGCIVPSGIATDDTTKYFFQDLIRSRALVNLHSFENEEFLFPGVHHSTKFCLLSLAGPERPSPAADFVFFARRVEHLGEADRHFCLSAEDIALLSPNTGTCPIFRSQRDAEINKAIYRRLPVLIREGAAAVNPWGMALGRMLHMADDSELFRTKDQLESEGWSFDRAIFRRGDEMYVPMYEAKMVHHFDHRFGTYEGQTESQANQGKLPELDVRQHADPDHFVLPWYWVPKAEVDARLKGKWDRHWLLGWRDICRNTDTRTAIVSLIPKVGIGHTFPLILANLQDFRPIASLYANLCSIAFDYITRQKIGGTHLTYSLLEQLPVVPHEVIMGSASWEPDRPLCDWFLARVLELSFTAWDLEPFARDCGHHGPPYRWDVSRRFLLRCELDAAFFHLYGVGRGDADYIMETFPVVRRKDEQEHGEYRTKRVILEIYDDLSEAARGGQPYRTRLDPPPADPRVAHPRRHAAGTPSRTQAQRGQVSLYILLLLRAWNKPVSREVLDAAIVLMLNDEARRAILGRRLSEQQRTRLGRPPVTIGGLDLLLEALLDSQTIGVVMVQDRQALLPGQNVPPTDQVPTVDAIRVEETLRAIEELGMERVRLALEEVVDEGFELVS